MRKISMMILCCMFALGVLFAQDSTAAKSDMMMKDSKKTEMKHSKKKAKKAKKTHKMKKKDAMKKDAPAK